MNDEQVIISDPKRTTPLVVQRRDDGGIAVHSSRSVLILSAPEAEKLSAFVSGRPCIERHRVTPATAKLARVNG